MIRKEQIEGLENALAALAGRDIHVYRNLTGTPAVTTSPYYHCTRWDVTDSEVTKYKDGMVVCVKVPDNGLGNGSYGTALQINSLGYKPVVYNVNSMIGTRYSVGSVVWAVYNGTQKAKLYLGEGHQNEEITGCWQVMDYNSDTTNITNLRHAYNSRVPTAKLFRYVLAFSKDEYHIVPMHSDEGNSGSALTATTKTMTSESFNPFGEIYIYLASTAKEAGANTERDQLFIMYGSLLDGRHTFNVTNSTSANYNFTAYRELYLVVDLQPDGMVKLATEGNYAVNPWSNSLPTTNDGHLYILLGFAYDKYRYEFYAHHPIYYHDGTQLRIYTGAKQFSGDYNDLTNKPDIPTVRTVNHEQLTDSSLGDANLHDGFYFPNAVKDADGNWYGAVVVGDQVWMAENLRTTHYADGTAITQGDIDNISNDPLYFAVPSMEPAVYGLYYTRKAVMNGEDDSDTNPSGVQGIAMDGWHIPSKSECEQLKGYVEKQSRYNYGNGKSAKALAATLGWTDSDIEYTPGNNKNENNAAGLNLVAAGRVYNGFGYQGRAGYFWTTTGGYVNGHQGESEYYRPFNCYIAFQNPILSIGNDFERQGMSVRLLSDMTPVQFRNWYVEQYGSLQHRLDEVFRCEMQAQLPNGTMQGGVSYADIQSAINNGKTVFCTLYDDITDSTTVLISNIGTPLKLSGTKVENNVLYCFEATFGGGTGSGEYWNVQYKAIQTSSLLPALSGNEGKVLSVNSNEDGVEWRAPFSGSYSDLTNKPVNANFGTGVVHAGVDNTSATINVPFSGYSLLNGGLINIKFKNDVVANAKLNINNKGAYQIWFRGGQIKSGDIKAGDRCLFMYNAVSPGYYILVSNDRWGVGV